MTAVLQRVTEAAVSIGGNLYSAIGKGFLVLLGVSVTDTAQDGEVLAAKIAGLRIFEDASGKLNLSLSDVEGECLVVSNFTLCANCRKGRRPSFEAAMKPPESDALYRHFCALLSDHLQKPVRTGVFGADMQIALTNDGPVTLVLNSSELK